MVGGGGSDFKVSFAILVCYTYLTHTHSPSLYPLPHTHALGHDHPHHRHQSTFSGPSFPKHFRAPSRVGASKMQHNNRHFIQLTNIFIRQLGELEKTSAAAAAVVTSHMHMIQA